MRNSSGTLLGSQVWAPVNLGGLGYVTGIDIATDGTWEMCRTDVGGGYRRESSTDTWTQIFTSDHMTLPSPLTTGGGTASRFGCFSIAISKADVAIAQAMFRGRMMRSINRGVDWVDDNFNAGTSVFMAPNGGNQRVRQHKLLGDPTNSAVFYAGTQKDGGWQRLNGVWSKIASIPTSAMTDDNEKTVIFAIDPTSSTVGSGATLRKAIVYATSSGNGLYKSTDGGATFSLISTTPSTGATFNPKHLICDAGGVLWMPTELANPNLYKSIDGGVNWSSLNMGFGSQVVASIEQDPKNTSRFVGMAGGGYPWESLNSCATTGKMWNPGNNNSVANSVPIIASVLNATFAASANASAKATVPHPTLARTYTAMGLGVCYFAEPYPTSQTTTLTWNEDAAGIEELVANYIHITPNGTAVVGSQDKSLIRLTGNSSYPPSSYPPEILRVGYGIDSAIDDPTYIVGISNVATAYSINDGRDWASFSSSLFTKLGGGIAVGNKPNAVRFQGQNGWPSYTLDGVTWATPTFTGYTMPAEGTGNGWGFGAQNTRRHIVCKDEQNPGTFYAYNSTDISGTSRGIWKSTNGGATWARVNTTSIINPLFVGYHNHLKMNRGILYLCPGESGDSFDGDTTNQTFRSEDGGVTWTVLGQLYEINLLAIGKPAPGSLLHTLYALGWKTISGVPTFGMYWSFDKGVTWSTLTNDSTFDHAYAMDADKSKFGRVIVGYTGTGYAEMDYSYSLLLKGS